LVHHRRKASLSFDLLVLRIVGTNQTNAHHLALVIAKRGDTISSQRFLDPRHEMETGSRVSAHAKRAHA
jgi:ribosomal protein L18